MQQLNDSGFDASKYYLGTLCARGHEWGSTCKSLRKKRQKGKNGDCVECVKVIWPTNYQKNRQAYIDRAAQHKRKKSAEKKRLKALIEQQLETLLETDGVDRSKFMLGPECSRRHFYNDSGHCLRYRNGSHDCVECSKARSLNRHYEKREEVRQYNYIKYRSNIDFYRQRARQYYWKDPDKARAAKRADNLKHREKRRAYHRRHYKSIPIEIHRAKRRIYAAANPEVGREAGRRYRRNNPEKVKSRRQVYRQTSEGRAARHVDDLKRRALKRSVHHSNFTSIELKHHYGKFDNACVYCGANEKLTTDHFIPLILGGPHCLGNIVPACPRCNFSKQCHDPWQWYSTQTFFSKTRWQKILKTLGKKDLNQLELF